MARKAIFAVDFDGTIVTHEFPKIGQELPYMRGILQALRRKGHQVFLWTMRGHPDLSRYGHTNYETGEYIPQDTLQEAIDWCKERGIEFDGINQSPAQFSTSLKQYARVYIDDAALGCPLKYYKEWNTIATDWSQVAMWLRDMGYFTQDEMLDALGVYHGHKIPETSNPNNGD